MSQTLYDGLQGNSNDDEDLFQCGKCKKQFYSLGTFMLHKKTHQLGSSSTGQQILSEDLASDVSNEADLQLQPIILSESDILSFSIGQGGLNLTADQGLNGFEENDALLMPETEDSQLKDSRDLSGSFELRSTQIILTTQITNEEPMERLLLTDTGSETGPTTYTLDLCKDFDTDNNIEEEGQMNKLKCIEVEDEKKLEKEAKLKCPYCFKQFFKNFDLQQHLRTHTGERPFQCVVCGRSFTQKSNVKKHMATHKVWPHKIRTLPEKPIQKISSLTSEETVVVDGSFVCQYCPSSFSSFSQLKSHRKKHAGSKIYKCVQKNCQQVFETLDLFLDHTAGHQTDCNTQYRCCQCKKQFTSLDELGNHQRLQGPCLKKKNSVAICKLCKKKFSTAEALERHQSEEPHSYPCPECNKVYLCERFLRKHLISHTSLSPHPCPECCKTFKTAQNLSIHMLVHSTERPFTCKVCMAAFVRRDRLLRHMFIHDTTHRFKCPFSKHLGCKKEFYRKDKLKQHMLSHSASKSLKCQRCSRVFKRSSQLKQHEAVCLSEDKPCKDCGHITTSLDHYKKNTTKTKERSYVNRRKHRLLESSKEEDDNVPTIQVVVVPLNDASQPELLDI